ncbi:MAG: tryptophan-rich sensory protein [Alphaproteobacteria bacterium]|nr:tryptophan-rich sensory protein [Alphaproteobacteria bacterium]
MTLKIIQGLYSFILVFITFLISKHFTDIGLENFYETINVSDITPENNYFRYIWKALYILLFLSFFTILVSKKSVEQFDDANALFIFQLFLQILWTFSFFYMGQLLASSIVIVLLVIEAFLMIYVFYPINKWAVLMVFPYLIWIMFASYLNIYIVFIN